MFTTIKFHAILFLITITLPNLPSSAQASPQKAKSVELSIFTSGQNSEYNFRPQLNFIRNIENKKTIKNPEVFPLSLEAGQHTMSITCKNNFLSKQSIIKKILISNEKYITYCKATIKRGHSDTGSIISVDAHVLNADSFDKQQTDPTIIN